MTLLLQRAAHASIEGYNPSHTLEAVNYLIPFGKERALGAIDSFLQNHATTDNYGLFWVLRVLFDIPSNHFPPVLIGRPYPPPPQDAAKLPRFPIVLVEDIPFLVVRGYDLAGLPEPLTSHVEYLRKTGVIRSQILVPPATSYGLAQELLQLWKAAYGEAYTGEILEIIERQILTFGLPLK